MKNINFEKKTKLSTYTTIKVGGFAEYFAEPTNINELVKLINWAHFIIRHKD